MRRAGAPRAGAGGGKQHRDPPGRGDPAAEPGTAAHGPHKTALYSAALKPLIVFGRITCLLRSRAINLMRYRARSVPAPPPQRGRSPPAALPGARRGTAQSGTARYGGGGGLASSEHRLSRRRPGENLPRPVAAAAAAPIGVAQAAAAQTCSVPGGGGGRRGGGGGLRGGRGPSRAWRGDLLGRWLRLGKGGRGGGGWLRLAMGDLRGKGRGWLGSVEGGGAGCRDCWGRRLLLLLLLLLLFLGGGGGGSGGGGWVWGGPRSAGGDGEGGGRRLRPRRGHEVRAVGEASPLFLIKETTFIER